MGWDNNDKFTVYSVDNMTLLRSRCVNLTGIKSPVCQFDSNKITSISDPTNETGVANKNYVDSIKPVITIWATAKRILDAGGTGWHMGVTAIGDKQASYVMPVSGRILYGSLGINTNSDIPLYPDVNVVRVEVNREGIPFAIPLSEILFTHPVNAITCTYYYSFRAMPNIR